jgi:hypothetical protein
MASVTALLVLLSFLAGCVTFVLGVRAGHDATPLAHHLYWGALTLVLQLFATGIAIVHARAATARRVADGPPPAA